MLVYGIRCSPTDLVGLPTQATADYYLDYSLLVFPSYTKPLTLSTNSLNSAFWNKVQRVVQHPGHVSELDFEQPWITDEESDVLHTLQKSYPGLQTNWYYVPRLAN
jgi:hypothetical protein